MSSNNDRHVIEHWAAIYGQWQFEGAVARFRGKSAMASPPVTTPRGPQESATAIKPMGLAVGPAMLQDGHVSVTVCFEEMEPDGCAHIILGYAASTQSFVSAGLGWTTFGSAYAASRRDPSAWVPLGQVGSSQNLSAKRDYTLDVHLVGQRLRLEVDRIPILERDLFGQLAGKQVGLFAYGAVDIEFKRVTVQQARPKAFVVMQFAEPYDSLYKEVIQPVANQAGLDAYNVGDLQKPGVILGDIIQGISEAKVIIAEITPPNPNVFYELGYAHAVGKPTILLVDRNAKDLPFDIQGFRCIFYDNTISGKSVVEASLRKHLTAIFGDN